MNIKVLDAEDIQIMFRSIRLQLTNPNYSPRHIEAEYASDPSWFSIIGKVVAVVRKSVPICSQHN